ncbi:hypothetical protein EUGRSUZ_I02412 [Eucalyptus grandis]|uniref:Uncharacterized protein n=2 Tax=Eucalyptus grandis TaxID=71139 RepID=A0ACC3JI65_EUCGR|nr:hypothetical protein EUGRSUZ_I02412 [Eucalyptus grandis]
MDPLTMIKYKKIKYASSAFYDQNIRISIRNKKCLPLNYKISITSTASLHKVILQLNWKRNHIHYHELPQES